MVLELSSLGSVVQFFTTWTIPTAVLTLVANLAELRHRDRQREAELQSFSELDVRGQQRQVFQRELRFRRPEVGRARPNLVQL